MRPVVRFQWLEGADAELGLPEAASEGAAGLDLRANLSPDARGLGWCLGPGERALVPLGLAMALPEGFEAQFRPRSGLALRHGVTVLNSPGTIDADYRGPLGVIVINHGQTAFRVRHGMRIAQMLVAPVIRPEITLAVALDATARGSGGFGSTGLG